MGMDDIIIGEYISDARNILQKKYGFTSVSLSELLSLRRFIIEIVDHQGKTPFTEVDIPFESVARLLMEYYDMDFADLHRLDNGKISIAMYSTLISDDTFCLSQEFLDYITIRQEKMYTP